MPHACLRQSTFEVFINTTNLVVSRLFVYGTLRPGSENEHAIWLAQNAIHAGHARTPGRLFQFSHYPALSAPLTTNDWVQGDVFEGLTAEMMSRLDCYEGSEYIRQVAEVTLDSGATVAAYLYYFVEPIEGLQHLPSGDWFQR